MPKKKIFENRLRDLRKARGETQGQMASALLNSRLFGPKGVSQQILSRWEAGRRPSLENIRRLAKFHGMEAAEIFPGLV